MSDPRRPVVVFGAESLSRLAVHALRHDAGRDVAAVTVDAAYVRSDTCFDLPLLPFESLPERFPPDSCELLLPIGYRQMHALRIARCEKALAMGYTLTHFVSRRACLASGVEPRANVLIYELANVQPFVQLGWNVTLRAGANIGHDSVVGDHTFVASGAVTGGYVKIGERCWIGLGAVLRNGVRLADRTFVGAGAVVVADTESDGIYIGNPARRMPGRSALDLTSRPQAGHRGS